MAEIKGARVAVPSGQTLNLRKTASSSGTILYKPSSGTKLTCDSSTTNAQWITVTSYDSTCYGMREYIDTGYCTNPSITNLFGGTGSSNNIRQSSTRKAVVYNLQWALTRLGYFSGTVDGIFGNATLTAVNNYQDAKSGSHDGIVGDNTKAWLVADLEAVNK